MNRLVFIHVPADVVYRRACAILMPAVLLGFCLIIGGIALHLVTVRDVGLGLFLVATISLLAIVLLTHRCEQKL